MDVRLSFMGFYLLSHLTSAQMVLNGCFSVSENNSSAMGASSHSLQIYLSVCVSVCHVCSSARGGQKKVVNALQLELQAVAVRGCWVVLLQEQYTAVTFEPLLALPSHFGFLS